MSATVPLLLSPKGPDAEHVTELKPWVVGRCGTYHHRPRSAHRYTDRLTVDAWCGQLLHNPVVHDEEPVDRICGTCEGRFRGWQREQRMIFRPEDGWALPSWCPCRLACRGEICPVCGAPGRSSYYRYGGVDPARHKPGPGLADWAPCPDHGWKRLSTINGTVVCTAWVGGSQGACAYELEEARSA